VERVGGEISRHLGRRMRQQKNEENKSDRGLRRPPDDDFTQQPTKNMQVRRRGDQTGRAT